MITDFWKDTGTPEDILQANTTILENMQPYFHGTKEDNTTIEGNVMIGQGTIIKKGCKIIGPTIIGKNCIIANGAYVGSNSSIGDNSNLSHCNVKSSIIMSNCEINCDTKIKNSIIASNSHISMKSSDHDEKVFLL